MFYSDSWKLIPCFRTLAISHPYISFFHLLVNGFSETSFHIFEDPLPLLYWWHWWAALVGGIGGRGGIKIVPAKYNQLISSKGPCSTAKTYEKSTNLRKNGIYWYKWCCDRFSILGENLYEEVDNDENDNYYYEYIARNDSFSRAPDIDFHYETKARDFKFDALYS